MRDKRRELLLNSHPDKASQLGKKQVPPYQGRLSPSSRRNRLELLLVRPLTGCDIWSDQWWLSADSSQQELRKRPRESSAEKGQLNWTFSSSVASRREEKRREEKRREEKRREEKRKLISHCRIITLKSWSGPLQQQMMIHSDDGETPRLQTRDIKQTRRKR